MKTRNLSAFVVASALAVSVGTAAAASTIVEQTPQGYTLRRGGPVTCGVT